MTLPSRLLSRRLRRFAVTRPITEAPIPTAFSRRRTFGAAGGLGREEKAAFGDGAHGIDGERFADHPDLVRIDHQAFVGLEPDAARGGDLEEAADDAAFRGVVHGRDPAGLHGRQGVLDHRDLPAEGLGFPDERPRVFPAEFLFAQDRQQAGRLDGRALRQDDGVPGPGPGGRHVSPFFCESEYRDPPDERRGEPRIEARVAADDGDAQGNGRFMDGIHDGLELTDARLGRHQQRIRHVTWLDPHDGDVARPDVDGEPAEHLQRKAGHGKNGVFGDDEDPPAAGIDDARVHPGEGRDDDRRVPFPQPPDEIAAECLLVDLADLHAGSPGRITILSRPCVRRPRRCSSGASPPSSDRPRPGRV